MQVGIQIQRTIPSAQYKPAQQVDVTQSNTISGLVILLLPFVVTCVIMGYRKHKAMVRQQRIQHLNQLWQLGSSKKLS